jgi:integral membrane protein (TIGR01906 family)
VSISPQAAGRVAVVVLAASVPFALALNGVRLIARDWFPAFEYGRSWFPADPYGMTRAERTRLARIGLHSVQPGGPGIALLREARLADGREAFREKELRHMSDVRSVLGAGLWLHVGILVAWAAALAATVRARDPELSTLVPRALRAGAILTLALAAGIAVLVLIDDNVFLTGFHSVFFEGDSWRFRETDTLRRLYPDRFWGDTAIVLGAGAAAQAALLLGGSHLWLRRAGRPRARGGESGARGARP